MTPDSYIKSFSNNLLELITYQSIPKVQSTLLQTDISFILCFRIHLGNAFLVLKVLLDFQLAFELVCFVD